MSWFSVIKHNIIDALTHAVPAAEQQPVHDKATAVAHAIGELLGELETVASGMLDAAIIAMFGPAADIVAHDFYNAVIAVATARKASSAMPAPVPAPPVNHTGV